MAHGFFGKKLGMTQVFSGNKVVPVTVVDVSNWFVLGQKRKRWLRRSSCMLESEGKPFSADWLKKLKNFFRIIKEVKLGEGAQEISVGQPVDFHESFAEGALVDVAGTTKGCGFAGVVRRHNFAGGRASHGSMMGDRPGSIGFMCKCGRVIKGKKLPGHMGANRRTVQNLELVKVDKDSQVILVKGCVPGKAGSVVFVQNGVKA